MRRYAVAGACLLVALLWGAVEACAQTMEQVLDPGDEGPVVFGDPAAIAKQRAEQRLALSLYRRRSYVASHRVLRAIAATPGHVERRAALSWLARLATRLPDGAVGDDLARYTRAQLSHLEPAAVRSTALFHAGRARYERGDLDRARELLGSVAKDHASYPRARILMGMVAVRLGEAKQAAKAFVSALRAVDDTPHRYPRADDLRDLLHLSLARLFYTAAHGEVLSDKALVTFLPGTHRRTTPNYALLSRAARYWSRVERTSPWWGRALLERAWVRHVAGDYSHVLGLVHSLRSPFFEDTPFPEAEVVAATTHLATCDYDRARSVAGRLERSMQRSVSELDALLKRDEARQLRRLARGRSPATSSAVLRAALAEVARDRRIRSLRAYERRAAAELSRLGGAPLSARDRRMAGAHLREAWRDARAQSAARARQLVKRARRQLVVHARDAVKIQIETVAAMRDRLEEPITSGYTTAPEITFSVMPDEEHVVWPFDGEYWRDEIGTYRAVVPSRCW